MSIPSYIQGFDNQGDDIEQIDSFYCTVDNQNTMTCLHNKSVVTCPENNQISK